MITREKQIPVYLSATFSQQSEMKIIDSLLESRYFDDPYIQRRLAAYPAARESERNILILQVFDNLWSKSKSSIDFSVFKDFEDIFALIDNKRGHFVHQFEVFIFGWMLIKLLAEKRINSLQTGSEDDEKTLFDTWLLTSSAHDFGYPFEMAKEVTKKISTLYEKLFMNKLAESYNNLLSGYSLTEENNLLNVTLEEVKDSPTISLANFVLEGIQLSVNEDRVADGINILKSLSKENNHSYVSALLFCRTHLTQLSKTSSYHDTSSLQTKKIAGAIALHALKESHYLEAIDFDRNPLAYLLFIIDNIQDWNRTLRPSPKWPSYSLSSINYEPDGLCLSYYLDHENWNPTMVERVKKSLIEKDNILHLPKKPSQEFGFQIKISFEANNEESFESILLNI
jgi:hypothetical protein